MSAIPQPAPQPWVVDPSSTPLTYTRPLVGSECFADRVSVMFDGSGDVCMGVNFSSPISKEELKQRARGALDNLRHNLPPFKASEASIAGPEDGVYTRNWVYSPVANDLDRQAWLDVAFSFEERGASLNTYDFIQTTNTKRLPYEVNGKTSLFRYCLLADDTGGYGLSFHGPHAIMDRWLHALALMFGWMSDAAGRIQLLQEVAAQQLRPVPCHTLAPPSRATNMDRKPIRIKHAFSSSETKALVDATRRSGFSVTHLLEAAHCLALFACSPLECNAVPEVDFSAETTIFSLEREFTASVNPKTHLISSFSVMPWKNGSRRGGKLRPVRPRWTSMSYALGHRITDYVWGKKPLVDYKLFACVIKSGVINIFELAPATFNSEKPSREEYRWKVHKPYDWRRLAYKQNVCDAL
ncbi:hypothetical protein F5I97DRAFT_2072671 [Phlebopus sp. FC_14]|nr:hypothetical protein F5I97DRAFT_2072671 [Phlebopus sp. FC_14]